MVKSVQCTTLPHVASHFYQPHMKTLFLLIVQAKSVLSAGVCCTIARLSLTELCFNKVNLFFSEQPSCITVNVFCLETWRDTQSEA